VASAITKWRCMKMIIRTGRRGRRRSKTKLIINEVPLSKNEYVNMHWAKRKAYKDGIFWLIEGELANRKRPKYNKANIAFNIYF